MNNAEFLENAFYRKGPKLLSGFSRPVYHNIIGLLHGYKFDKRDFGGMLSVQLHGGREAALAMAGKLRLFTNATSLGGCESLVEHRASTEGPHTTTPQNLLRMSVGLEHVEDLIADLAQALEAT